MLVGPALILVPHLLSWSSKNNIFMASFKKIGHVTYLLLRNLFIVLLLLLFGHQQEHYFRLTSRGCCTRNVLHDGQWWTEASEMNR